MRLADKVAIVTGSTFGIGKEAPFSSPRRGLK